MASKQEEYMPVQSSNTSLNPPAVEFSSQRKIQTISSNNDLPTKIDSVPEITAMCMRLTLFLELKLKPYALYYEFKRHLLTGEQLKKFGFPEEAPGRPDRAIIRTQNLAEGSTERRCSRCGSNFTILQNGQYISDSNCRYHAKKKVFIKGIPHYPCCNRACMAEGCTTWQYHVTAECALHDIKFVKTEAKKRTDKTTAGSVYALDCEMVFTTAGMEVVKVGLVGVDGSPVFESFVLPQNQILDYNTAYSGVSEKDLEGVSTTLQDVQAYLLRLLNKESILVGHGLENDLKALRIIHYNVIDTSVTFPRNSVKYPKRSLKAIAKEILDKDIQMSAKGHNCIEDARTCMELMLHKINSDLETKKRAIGNENKKSMPRLVILPEDIGARNYNEYIYAFKTNYPRYTPDYLMPYNDNCFYG